MPRSFFVGVCFVAAMMIVCFGLCVWHRAWGPVGITAVGVVIAVWLVIAVARYRE